MKMFAFHCGGEKTLRSVFDPLRPCDCGSTIHVPYFFYLIPHPDVERAVRQQRAPACLDDRAAPRDAATCTRS